HFEFARSAHHAAHLLRPQRRGAEGEEVGLLVVTDILIHQTIVAGCIKAGLVVRRLLFYPYHSFLTCLLIAVPNVSPKPGGRGTSFPQEPCHSP
ncbi:hypothetical protein DFH06DRAFT_920182, partial [Mycena polygramma]